MIIDWPPLAVHSMRRNGEAQCSRNSINLRDESAETITSHPPLQCQEAFPSAAWAVPRSPGPEDPLVRTCKWETTGNNGTLHAIGSTWEFPLAWALAAHGEGPPYSRCDRGRPRRPTTAPPDFGSSAQGLCEAPQRGWQRLGSARQPWNFACAQTLRKSPSPPSLPS